jgi:hypothetical protein
MPGDSAGYKMGSSLPLAHGAFAFDNMVSGRLDSEMIADTAKIVNEAIKDKVQVNLITNNRAGGNAPLIAQKIATGFIQRSRRGCFNSNNVLDF